VFHFSDFSEDTDISVNFSNRLSVKYQPLCGLAALSLQLSNVNVVGKVFPSQGDLHIAPFTDEALYMEQCGKANFW